MSNIMLNGLVEDDGHKIWYKDGKFHRIDGPAIIYQTGTMCWYQNDEMHRVDGPAIEDSGFKVWVIHGKLLTVDQENIARRIIAEPDWPGKFLYLNDPLLKPIIEHSIKKE